MCALKTIPKEKWQTFYNENCNLKINSSDASEGKSGAESAGNEDLEVINFSEEDDDPE